jgi:hypothetical protein
VEKLKTEKNSKEKTPFTNYPLAAWELTCRGTETFFSEMVASYPENQWLTLPDDEHTHVHTCRYVRFASL